MRLQFDSGMALNFMPRMNAVSRYMTPPLNGRLSLDGDTVDGATVVVHKGDIE